MDRLIFTIVLPAIIAWALFIGAVCWLFCGAHATGYAITDNESVHKPTYPKIVNEWFSNLSNYQGGSCCGLGDAYPAEILEAPLDGVPNSGTVRITNPGGRMIWIDEHYGIEIPPITQENLTFKFSHEQVTHELQGNPLGHAIIFVSVDTEGHVSTIYCVVPLPPSF